MAPLTDPQLRERVITNTTGPQLVGCGAGGGKTRLLVDHYLQLLTEGLAPAQIIAVTFTEAAAAELKERIRTQCRARAAAQEPGSIPDWRRLAVQVELAHVSTIHGLCSAILREHALAAGLDPGFAVLDQTESSLLLTETVRQSLLTRLDEQDSAARLVADWGLGGAVALLGEIIGQRAKLGEWLAQPPSVETLRAAWEQTLLTHQQRLLAGFTEGLDWDNILETLREHSATDPEDKLELVKEAVLEHLPAVLDTSASFVVRLQAARGLAGCLRNKTFGTVGAKTKWPGGNLQPVRDALDSFLNADTSQRQALDGLSACVLGEVDDQAAGQTQALLVEAAAAGEDYAAAKRVRVALDFEDLQTAVRDLWERAPEVLQGYRRRVRHLLIDEFQDTSRLQMAVLSPLCGAGGAVLFVVGDPKQSIYGWRDADLSLWHQTHAALLGQAGPDSLTSLSRCFRSSASVLDFFNLLFACPPLMGVLPPGAEPEPFRAYYEPLEADRLDAPTPAIEVTLITAPPEESEPADSQTAVSAETDADTAGDTALGALRLREALWLARRVQALVGEPLPVWDREAREWRPVTYGDCAVLLRSFTDVGLYEWAFRQTGVPTYVYAGRGFYALQEVRDVVCGLRVLENHDDEVALLGALRSPLFALSDETLFWMSEVVRSSRSATAWWRLILQAGSGSLHPLLAERLPAAQVERLFYAGSVLSDLEARKNRLTLSELITELLARTGLKAALAAQRTGAQAVANLEKLCDLASAFEGRSRSCLRDFLRTLAELQAREERESAAPIEDERSPSVKFMTMHTAKGLEWPVVILPDLGRQPQPDRGAWRWHPDLGLVAHRNQESNERPALWQLIHEQSKRETQAEAQRLFYVACTRARDRLLLGSVARTLPASDKKPPRLEIKNGSVLQWLTEAFGWGAEDLATWAAQGETPPLSGFPMAQPRLLTLGDIPLYAPQPSGNRPESPLEPKPALHGVAAIRAQVQPIARRFAARDRYTATELATYGFCPYRYYLTRLQGMPESRLLPPQSGDADQLTAAERGEVLHHLLRLVGKGGVARLDEVLDSDLGLDARLEVRARQAKADLHRTLLGFLEQDDYRRLIACAEELRTEMRVALPLAVTHGTVIIEGILDACTRLPDGSRVVLDYKTGDPEEGGTAEMYGFQVGVYCAAVRAGLGEIPAQALLVYLQPAGPVVTALDAAAEAGHSLQLTSEYVEHLSQGDFEPRATPPCHQCRLQGLCRRALL